MFLICSSSVLYAGIITDCFKFFPYSISCFTAWFYVEMACSFILVILTRFIGVYENNIEKNKQNIGSVEGKIKTNETTFEEKNFNANCYICDYCGAVQEKMGKCTNCGSASVRPKI